MGTVHKKSIHTVHIGKHLYSVAGVHIAQTTIGTIGIW